jgi:hypothetical protein
MSASHAAFSISSVHENACKPMTVQASPERETRIDVLRALALLTIFVDHVPGNAFERLTYRNFGFSDAAEVFVLLSGMAVGLAYGARFGSGDRLASTLKMWRRAGVLYVSHIVMTVLALAIFSVGALYADRPDLLQQINIGPVMDDTAKAFVGIVTLGHQLGYNNILSVYALLLLLSPMFLLFAVHWPKATLAVSGVLWLVAGLAQIAPPNYPLPGYWFLNPLSWQFLFVVGMIGTMHVRRGGAVPVNCWLIGAAAAYVLAALAWIYTPLWGVDRWFGLPAVLTGFDKTFLSASRLLHILAVAYLFVAIPSLGNLARTSADHPLAILGKRSLPVFIAGTILALLAQVAKTINPGGTSRDMMLIVGGIGAQFMLAYYLEWRSSFGKRTSLPAVQPRSISATSGAK